MLSMGRRSPSGIPKLPAAALLPLFVTKNLVPPYQFIPPLKG